MRGSAGDQRELTKLHMADPNSNDPDRLAIFIELYTKHYPRLQYYVMALVPVPHDAADVLQETSVVLWSKFGDFDLGTNFFAWACKIARLQTLKLYEKNKRSASKLDAEVLELLSAEAAGSDSQSEPALSALDDCLAKLPRQDQELIRRRYEPNVSVNQIAEEIGVSANLLSKSLGKIRRSLLACVERTLLSDA